MVSSYKDAPKDIRETAGRLVDDYRDASLLEGAICAALVYERERAARIAETLSVYPELNVSNGGPEWYRHGRDIARAIRGGS